MVKGKEDHPSWEDFAKHDKRIAQLEKKVGQLLKAIADLNGDVQPSSTSKPVKKKAKPEPKSKNEVKQRNGEDMSPPMQYIVVLMRNGDTEAAFSEFQALPKSELIKQPVTAATLAAAICVTRGDFDAGIKALEHVQQLTDDPRVEEIKQKLIKQAADQKS